MFGYSKQAYYKQLHQMEDVKLKEGLIIELIKNKRQLWKKGSGRNLLASLNADFKEHGITIGRDKFYDILRSNGLLIKNRKRRVYTTNSFHHFRKYPNIIKGINPLKPGQIIVSDITYIWIKEIENFAYLFLITDVYSRKILGYCLSDSLKANSAVIALKMAIKQLPVSNGCIHHSDRGIQYCCFEYTGILKKNHMKISMTENGDPLENAIAERVNKTIKEEFTNGKTLSFKSFSQAKSEMPKFIKFYNEQRPHRSIDMLTPNEAFKRTGELKRRWRSYYKQKGKIEEGGIF
jgi:transposase InsO family protein